jgi:site-specific DNA recombinase
VGKKRKNTSNDGPKPLLAINYCRVSGQYDEREASLDSQRDANNKAARDAGAVVVATKTEKHSGQYLWEREVLSEVREMLREGKANTVVVYALDRLSRSQEHIAILYAEIRRAGGQLISATEGAFADTPIGQLIMSVYAFKARAELESIRDRTSRGRAMKINRGLWPGAGGDRYGYRNTWREDAVTGKRKHTGDREISEDEGKIVQRIYTLIADQVAPSGVADQLNSEGIPTRSQSLGRKFTGCGQWNKDIIRKIVRDPIYTGTADVHIGETAVTLELPAIVDKALWQRANDALDARLRYDRSQGARWFMLRGLVYCGECERRCDIVIGGAKIAYYRCRANRTGRNCEQPHVRVEKVHSDAWDSLSAVMANPEKLRKAAERANRKGAPEREALQATITQMRAKVEKIEGQIERTIARIARAADEDEAELFEAQLGQLRADRSTATRAVDECIAQMESAQHVHIDVDAIVRTGLEVLTTRKEALSEEMRRRLFEATKVRVVLSGSSVRVDFPGTTRVQAGRSTS